MVLLDFEYGGTAQCIASGYWIGCTWLLSVAVNHTWYPGKSCAVS